MAALLASTQTEEEYLQIVQDIIQSQDLKTVLSQSSSSNSTSPAISLGDDNEFDCFGILPPIKRHLKKNYFRLLRLICFKPISFKLNCFESLCFRPICFRPFSTNIT